jgi:SAM-dependent methyltransferase
MLGGYGLISSNSFQFERLKSLRSNLYREAKIAKCQRILDIGCGDLKIAKEIKQRSQGDVFALDIEKTFASKDAIFFGRGDVRNIPFKTNSIVAVTASFIFLWIKDIKKAILEIKRVLSSDGKLIILSEPNLIEREDEFDSNFSQLLKKSLEEMGAKLELESELKENLKSLGFKGNLKKSEGKVFIEDKSEILEEVEFLLNRKKITKEESESFTQKIINSRSLGVHLPILYGIFTL